MLKEQGRRPALLLHTPRTKSAREPNEASSTRRFDRGDRVSSAWSTVGGSRGVGCAGRMTVAEREAPNC